MNCLSKFPHKAHKRTKEASQGGGASSLTVQSAYAPLRVKAAPTQKSENLHQLEKKYSAVFKKSVDILTEVNLSTGSFCRLYASDLFINFPMDGDYGQIVKTFLSYIHPEDQESICEARCLETLHKAYACRELDLTHQYRLLYNDVYVWIESRVFFIDEEGVSTAFLVARNISTQKQLELDREQELQHFTLVLRNVYDELYECNVTQNAYRIVYNSVNTDFMPKASGSLRSALALAVRKLIHPEDRKRFVRFLDVENVRADFAKGQEYRQEEFRIRRPGGEFCWNSLTMFPQFPLSSALPDKVYDEIYLIFSMDIDDRKQTETKAQRSSILESQRLADERYRIIVEQTNTLVFEWCCEGNTRFISEDMSKKLTGTYDSREIMDVWKEDAVIYPEDLPTFERFLAEAKVRSHSEMTVRFRTCDSNFIWCKVVLTCLRDAEGKLQRYIGTVNNVHEATCSTLALHYRAEYDILTGIYNMQTFYARASQLLLEQPERQYYILRMDIDRFKIINDLYGLDEGDRLLKTIARLLSQAMTPHSVCGRMNGDVFCMCVDYTTEQLLAFVQDLTDKLAQYPLPSRLVPSFGICRVDNVATPINFLCDRAHLALKTIKGNVLVSYAFYDAALHQRILEEKTIENEMHQALELGQFCMYLQPKVNVMTSQIVGAEALVRWKHPSAGLIQPDRFIPLFEKNGFIIRLDEYMWDQACQLLRSWLDRGLSPMPLSVNVSRVHIYDTRLCEKLFALMSKYQLSPSLLELELTENVLLCSESQLVKIANTLQERGFVLSLDDFGAGYSSLNMLKNLPIDVIKLDRGFLSEVAATDRGKVIIRHTISLAKDLNIRVIAEGVENAEQAKLLLEAGCSHVQGFYYSAPVPVNAYELMAFGNTRPFSVSI